MFGLKLTSNESFILGVGSLWVFSALVGALPVPNDKSSVGYTTLYKFLKTIGGDLGSIFGKYLPPAGTATVVALLCISLCVVPVIGCTQQQKISVAQEIVNLSPGITSAVDTIGATISLLDPVAAPIINVAMPAFNAASAGLQTAARDYLANPSQTTLQLLQAEVVKLQQQTNATLLQTAGIKDANSQKMAQIALNTLATLINTVLGLVQSISTKTQVAAMASQVHVTLAQVRTLLDQRAMQASADKVSHDLALNHAPTVDQFFAYEAQAGF